MSNVLSRKPTKDDSLAYILSAILRLATDKRVRVMLVEDNEWKATKLREIARLTRLAKRKVADSQTETKT